MLKHLRYKCTTWSPRFRARCNLEIRATKRREVSHTSSKICVPQQGPPQLHAAYVVCSRNTSALRSSYLGAERFDRTRWTRCQSFASILTSPLYPEINCADWARLSCLQAGLLTGGSDRCPPRQRWLSVPSNTKNLTTRVTRFAFAEWIACEGQRTVLPFFRLHLRACKF